MKNMKIDKSLLPLVFWLAAFTVICIVMTIFSGWYVTCFIGGIFGGYLLAAIVGMLIPGIGKEDKKDEEETR